MHVHDGDRVIIVESTNAAVDGTCQLMATAPS